MLPLRFAGFLISIEQIVAQAVDTDGALVSTRQSLATARAFRQSAYDAAYLDLARRERLPLATLDDNPMPAYANRLRQLLVKGTRAVVPTLWHREMSNGLAVAERRSILTTADVDQAMSGSGPPR